MAADPTTTTAKPAAAPTNPKAPVADGTDVRLSGLVDSTIANRFVALASAGDRPIHMEVARALREYVDHHPPVTEPAERAAGAFESLRGDAES